MNNRIVYSRAYDFGMWGMDKFHPFDMKKFSKAWSILSNSGFTSEHLLCPQTPVSDEVLQLIHTPDYIQSLTHSAFIAEVVEVGVAKLIPSKVLVEKLLVPIRLATQGTLLGAEYALNSGSMVMNLGGGYHHAFSDHGEGFCFFADAALAIKVLHQEGALLPEDGVAMIDLDAHRGNGFEACVGGIPKLYNFDMYNFQVYPGMHKGDVDEFPFMVPLRMGMSGNEYLSVLKEELPTFLEKIKDCKLVFYNAGTDILKGDPLGGLNVEFDQVVERDRYVLKNLRDLNIPTVVLTSGGYSGRSYELVAECGKILLALA